MENSENTIKGNVLVADDDDAFASAFSQMLRQRGYSTCPVNSKESILKALEQERYLLLILDLYWGSDKSNGLEILQEAKLIEPTLPVIILTGNATINTAVTAIKMGAFDYLEKGGDKEKTFITIKNAIDSGILLRENEDILNQIRSQFPIVGSSRSVKELHEHIARVGPAECNVLITGATGTGKEIVARHIHFEGKRRKEKFIAIDLGALPENLIESTLFGYVRGAFTGAVKDQIGYFDEVNGGTIFLDEISNTTLTTQQKLLRVLQTRQYYPVGSTELKQFSARIIAATNVELEALIRKGEFRKDLYYRINEYEIKMPSLADRKEDIPLLTRHFVNVRSREIKGYPMQIGAEAVNILIEREWPGNVRQLENAIKRIIVYTKNPEITSKEVLNAFDEKQENADQQMTLDSVTRKSRKEHIIKILNYCHGNITKTAEVLAIDRGHLYRLLDEYEIKQLAREFR